ncbi:MAG: glycosyltransferase [Pyrinomonadaceae bacterium]
MTDPAASIRQESVSKASGAKLRVLHFVPRICWPLDTGAKLRNYHLAREIAQRASITLLTFSENVERAGENISTRHLANRQPENPPAERKQQESSVEPHLPDPGSFYEQVITVRRDRGYTVTKIVRGAIGRTPLPVLNYTTRGMKQELARILDEQDFDIVQVESIHLADYLPIIRAARGRPLVVCDWHNIESELMRRYSERASNPLRRTYARRASRQMIALERRVTHEFDAHIAVSHRDAAKLLALAPGARVFVIENGVDTAYYADARIERAHAAWLAQDNNRAAANPSGPRRIAFVGSMDYHANADAAAHFAREVWPRLRLRQPELIFSIVGRDPAPEVRQLAEIPGVEITGTVDDVRPYYYETLAAIIPLRVGGGSRLKILEAMAAGVPVVSTPLGAEGLDVEHGQNIILAETGEELCEAIIAVSENDEQRKRLIDAGRALVSEHYDWSRLGAALFETYQSLLGDGEAAHVKTHQLS